MIYKLSEVAKIYSGATPLTKEDDYYENGTIPWITPKDLSNYKKNKISSGNKFITKKGFDSCSTKLIPKGSVLLTSRAPIGYIAIAENDICTNQGFKNIVCDENKLLNDYLYYYLTFNIDSLKAKGNGTTFKELSAQVVKKFEIDIPSVSEQKHTVRYISLLDDKKDINLDILMTLERILDNIYIKYFLTNSYNFQECNFGDIVKIYTGGTPSTKSSEYWEDGNIVWLTPKDITNNSSIFIDRSDKNITLLGLMNSSAKKIPQGNVIMTSRATIGDCVINNVDVTTNQGIMSLITKDYNSLNPIHLYHWIKHNKIKLLSISNGSTFKEIYKSDLVKLPININKQVEEKYVDEIQPYVLLYKNIHLELNIINKLRIKLLSKYFS